MKEIIEILRKFNQERDWDKFHDSKNLALAISIEASELNELFLWKSDQDANVDQVAEELADVFLCAFMMADKYNLDVKKICLNKIARNAEKYPVEKSKGNAKKYNEL
jgi:NTP pyrophosphatase (non-canonical NTP hydrolase)